jgi:hypothetical protein
LIKYFLVRNISGISGFLEYSAPNPVKGQNNSWPGKVKFPMVEVSPVRKKLGTGFND